MTEAGQNTEEGVWGSQGWKPSNCFQPEWSEWVSDLAYGTSDLPVAFLLYVVSHCPPTHPFHKTFMSTYSVLVIKALGKNSFSIFLRCL